MYFDHFFISFRQKNSPPMNFGSCLFGQYLFPINYLVQLIRNDHRCVDKQHSYHQRQRL